MGIFDIIELKNHCQAIGEYMFYIDCHPDDVKFPSSLVVEHVKKMVAILDKLEKNP